MGSMSDGMADRSEPTLIVNDVHVTYRVYASGKRINRNGLPLRRSDMRGLREIHALRGVSFAAHEGETIGVIGHNGSGKSTLFRAMTGLLPVTQGNVWAEQRPMLLGVNAALLQELSGAKNVRLGLLALGMGRRDIAQLEEGVAEFAGMQEYIDLPMRTYSSGMAARLKFAIATAREHPILLIDEALNVGDKAFRAKSADRIAELRKNAGTVMIVSHSMSSILEMCTRVIWLDHGKIKMDGAPEDVVAEYNGRPRVRQSKPNPTDVPVPLGAPPLRAQSCDPVALQLPSGASALSAVADGRQIRIFWRVAEGAAAAVSTAVSLDGITFDSPMTAMKRSRATANLLAVNDGSGVRGIGGQIMPGSSAPHSDGLYLFQWSGERFTRPRQIVAPGHPGFVDATVEWGSTSTPRGPASLVKAKHLGRHFLYVRAEPAPGRIRLQVATTEKLPSFGGFQDVEIEGLRDEENILFPNFGVTARRFVGILPIITPTKFSLRAVRSDDGIRWQASRDFFDASTQPNVNGNPVPADMLVSGIMFHGGTVMVYMLRDYLGGSDGRPPQLERYEFARDDLFGASLFEGS